MPFKNESDRRDYEKRRYAALKDNPEAKQKVLEKSRKNWRLRCLADPEAHKNRVRRYRREKPGASRRYSAWYARTFPHKAAAQAAKRRALKKRRTPRWADDEKILQVYTQAKIMSDLLGEAWHVDHIIPLQGKFVSGLHVHTNLQILPGPENLRKHNAFAPMTWTSSDGWEYS